MVCIALFLYASVDGEIVLDVTPLNDSFTSGTLNLVSHSRPELLERVSLGGFRELIPRKATGG